MLCWAVEWCLPSQPTGSGTNRDATGSGCCGSSKLGCRCLYAWTCLCSQGWGGGWGFWLAHFGGACSAFVCSVLGIVQRVAGGFPPSGPHWWEREGQPTLSAANLRIFFIDHNWCQLWSGVSLSEKWRGNSEGACQRLLFFASLDLCVVFFWTQRHQTSQLSKKERCTKRKPRPWHSSVVHGLGWKMWKFPQKNAPVATTICFNYGSSKLLHYTTNCSVVSTRLDMIGVLSRHCGATCLGSSFHKLQAAVSRTKGPTLEI